MLLDLFPTKKLALKSIYTSKFGAFVAEKCKEKGPKPT